MRNVTWCGVVASAEDRLDPPAWNRGWWMEGGPRRRAAAAPAHALALALLVTLVAACGRGPGTSGYTATPASTATPIVTPAPPPAGPLTWTPHRLPVAPPLGLPNDESTSGTTLSPAPSDGDSAYACAPAPNASAWVWLTHDRGADWSRRTDAISPDARGFVAIGCTVVVDALDPAAAVAQITLVPATTCVPVVDCTSFRTLLSTDAGQTWIPLRGPLPTLAQMATRQGVTYAIFRSAPRSASPGSWAFVRSVDGRRTWTPVPTPPAGMVAAFWLNPFSGGLLGLTGADIFNGQALWATTDGGSHWTALPPSVFAGDMNDLMVQQPFTDQPWRVCVGDRSNWYIGGQTNTHADDSACTSDGGAPWLTRHLDVLDNANGMPDFTPVAIADDGSLLVTTPAGLERFLPGSMSAQRLGVPPTASPIVYAAGTGAGVLWEGPIDNYPDADPLGRIFTASYN
ncbi:MAG TPA: hypothetical protein VIC85_06650 [Ktedonobacterales bacterium]